MAARIGKLTGDARQNKNILQGGPMAAPRRRVDRRCQTNKMFYKEDQWQSHIRKLTDAARQIKIYYNGGTMVETPPILYIKHVSK